MFLARMSYGCSVGCYRGSILLEYGMKDVFQAGFMVGFLSFFLFHFFFLSFPFLSVFSSSFLHLNIIVIFRGERGVWGPFQNSILAKDLPGQDPNH